MNLQKVLFVDIDGCLQHTASVVATKKHASSVSESSEEWVAALCPISTGLMRNLYENHDFHLCWISTQRRHVDLATIFTHVSGWKSEKSTMSNLPDEYSKFAGVKAFMGGSLKSPANRTPSGGLIIDDHLVDDSLDSFVGDYGLDLLPTSCGTESSPVHQILVDPNQGFTISHYAAVGKWLDPEFKWPLCFW